MRNLRITSRCQNLLEAKLQQIISQLPFTKRMFSVSMLWSLEFGAGVFHAFLVINLVMPPSCSGGIWPFQRVGWQSKNSIRNRPRQVRNLGWNLAQVLTKIILFYQAPSIPSGVFHLTENIASHQAHSIPPRTPHPTKRIS